MNLVKEKSVTIRMAPDVKSQADELSKQRGITAARWMNEGLAKQIKIDRDGCELVDFHDDPEKAKAMKALAEAHAIMAGVSVARWIGNLVIERLESVPVKNVTGWVVGDDNSAKSITVTVKESQHTGEEEESKRKRGGRKGSVDD